ncbi:DUF3097 domain-containing protein [Fodinicola acaciae]|uniref:DUF3097 domain-containing protein n=1 Tax=Fodinicola acaciae TaxID=2681555 RepID=UPI0013D31947|nr:DUF3097 domain-containing protein [Fodinicola acaciae]
MDYGPDIMANDPRRKRVATVPAELDIVVEEAGSGFCGAVVACHADRVVLEDRHGKQRTFPLLPAGFLLDGKLVTLTRPAPSQAAPKPRRTASGSVAVANAPARVARAGRIYVEGIHDAQLVEQIWGDDLRVEGVVVEPLHGVDDLPGVVADFRPGPGRRLGVLVDHLVAGSKESRIVASVTNPYVLVTGHPYVDIWQAVKPAAVGIRAWPRVPRGQDWKQGVCAALGVSDVHEMWRRVRSAVRDFNDLEWELLGAVERLVDFVLTDA